MVAGGENGGAVDAIERAKLIERLRHPRRRHAEPLAHVDRRGTVIHADSDQRHVDLGVAGSRGCEVSRWEIADTPRDHKTAKPRNRVSHMVNPQYRHDDGHEGAGADDGGAPRPVGVVHVGLQHDREQHPGHHRANLLDAEVHQLR